MYADYYADVDWENYDDYDWEETYAEYDYSDEDYYDMYADYYSDVDWENYDDYDWEETYEEYGDYNWDDPYADYSEEDYYAMYADYYSDVDWEDYEDYDYSDDYDASYDYYDDYSEEYAWSNAVYSTAMVSSEYDGWAAMYTLDWVSWYLWDQSGSICNLEMDWVDPEDMGAGVHGFTVKNDDGTCYYDEFYSTTTYNDDGSV
jgi:hypothetical protein